MIAGPNGAGKTTSAPRLLQDALAVQEFVNADVIAAGLSAFRPETVSFAAGRAMLGRMKALAAARRSFAFETTLASRTFAPWLRHLRGSGYHVHVALLTLPSPELAVARVAMRVRLGGHRVPDDIIRRRFEAGLRNFFGLYQELAETWQVFDNTWVSGPRLIAMGSRGTARVVQEPGAWAALEARYGS